MSWTRPARASKTVAASNISAMLAAHAQPPTAPNPVADPPPSNPSPPSGFSLKFKKEVWNAYTSLPPRASPISTTSLPSPKSKAGQKPKHRITTSKAPVSKPPKRSPAPRQCKVKLTRFQYGGPDRRERGKYRDMITLETPCLRPTCANCQRWHGHVLRDSDETEGVSVPSGQDAARPRLKLNLRFNTPASDKDRECDIDPVSVHASPKIAPCGTTSCEALRHSYIARLRFGSDAGKARFRALVHTQARKEIRMARKRLGRVAEDVVRQTLLQGDGVGGQMPQQRHRAKFAFDRVMGRENHRIVMGTHV